MMLNLNDKFSYHCRDLKDKDNIYIKIEAIINEEVIEDLYENGLKLFNGDIEIYEYVNTSSAYAFYNPNIDSAKRIPLAFKDNIMLNNDDYYLKELKDIKTLYKEDSKKIAYYLMKEINELGYGKSESRELYRSLIKSFSKFYEDIYMINEDEIEYSKYSTTKDFIDKKFIEYFTDEYFKRHWNDSSYFLNKNPHYINDLLPIKDKLFAQLKLKEFELYIAPFNKENLNEIINALKENLTLKNDGEAFAYGLHFGYYGELYDYFNIINQSSSIDDFQKNLEKTIILDNQNIKGFILNPTQIDENLILKAIFETKDLYFVEELKKEGYDLEFIKEFSTIYENCCFNLLKKNSQEIFTIAKTLKNLSKKEKDLYDSSSINKYLCSEIVIDRTSQNKIFSQEIESIFHNFNNENECFEKYKDKVSIISTLYEKYPTLFNFIKEDNEKILSKISSTNIPLEDINKIFSYLKNKDRLNLTLDNITYIENNIIDYSKIYEKYISNLKFPNINTKITKQDKPFVKNLKETFNFFNSLNEEETYNLKDLKNKKLNDNQIIKRVYSILDEEQKYSKEELLNIILLKDKEKIFLQNNELKNCFNTTDILSKEMIYEIFSCFREFSIINENLYSNEYSKILEEILEKQWEHTNPETKIPTINEILNEIILNKHKEKFETIISNKIEIPFESKNTDLIKMFKENNATGRRVPGIINELEYLVKNDLCKANDIVNGFKGKINIIRDKILPLGNPSLIGLYMMGLDFGQLSNDKIETLAFCSSRDILPKIKEIIPLLNETLNDTPNEIIIKAMETLKIINNKEIINNMNNLEELATLGLELKCNDIKNWYERKYNYNFSNYECKIEGPKVPNIFSEEYKDIEQRNQLMENLKTIVKDEYKAGLLTNEDILAFVVGDKKNGCACCEKPGEPGESCIYHATSNPNSGTFVIQRLEDDKMMAQAFTIYDEKTNTLIFDNIEFSNNRNVNQFIEILQEFSKACPYENIQLGMGYTSIDIGMPIEENDFINIKSILNGKTYSDYNSDARFLKKDGEITISKEDIENYREKQNIISLCD